MFWFVQTHVKYKNGQQHVTRHLQFCLLRLLNGCLCVAAAAGQTAGASGLLIGQLERLRRERGSEREGRAAAGRGSRGRGHPDRRGGETSGHRRRVGVRGVRRGARRVKSPV